MLITFGSIIARTGLVGEADYGLANEWLGRIVEKFQGEHPHCCCLNLEWSVWSGIGMGERLGRVDTLLQQGITPIPPDTGIQILHSLLNQSLPTTSTVIAGRFGEPVTLKLPQPELPFLRFLEQKRVYYPEIELIVDAELSLENDPYLQDHVYQGEYIFPGVMGLEAIAQVAKVLLKIDQQEQIRFESVEFNRPIVVSAHKPLKIRIAGLITEKNTVKAVIRSEQTGYSIDHFTAIVSTEIATEEWHLPKLESYLPSLINPETELYGELLFHQGRFQRIEKYTHLKAKECVAEIKTDFVTPWFSRYLPQELSLGDAGARDAVIHALQACIPHATILPTAIERLTIYQVNSSERQFVRAKERQHQQDTFVYDLEVLDTEGNVLETWQGLELKVIKHKEVSASWLPALLPTYLERQIQGFIPDCNLSLMVDYDSQVKPRERSDRNLQLLSPSFTRRADGKPELNSDKAISVSHTGDLTLVVENTMGCDVESVVNSEVEVWQDLLGVRYFDLAQVISQETKENFDISATRVWNCQEIIKKSGLSHDTPLILSKPIYDSSRQIIWLQSGNVQFMTMLVSVEAFETPLVFAVLLNRENCENRQKTVSSFDGI